MLLRLLIVGIATMMIVGDTFPSVAFGEASLLGLLEDGKYTELEEATERLQLRFEKGEISERDIRNEYRQFYQLNDGTLAKIEEWKRKIPTSYAACLIKGAYYKRKGFDVRGNKYISETPKDRLRAMEQYHEIAWRELEQSMKLTAKPFLSVFHLLEIARAKGDRNTSWLLMEAGSKMLPANTLIRNRFFISLSPRWGGTYGEMKEYIDRSRKEGVSRAGLMELEAIMHDDMGNTFLEQGNRELAIFHLAQALELAREIGGEFGREFLLVAMEYRCQASELKKYCA